ncbi:MAG: SpoVG family protein [Fibrobacterales bacterium]
MSQQLLITKLNVFPLTESKGKLKGFARVVLNDQITLSSLRIYDSINGLFVAYPSEPKKEGEEYRSIYNPITRDFKEYIQEAVLKEFEQNAVAA